MVVRNNCDLIPGLYRPNSQTLRNSKSYRTLIIMNFKGNTTVENLDQHALFRKIHNLICKLKVTQKPHMLTEAVTIQPIFIAIHSSIWYCYINGLDVGFFHLSGPSNGQESFQILNGMPILQDLSLNM